MQNSFLKEVISFLKAHFFTAIAIFIFFLIVTAQTFWSTIHGDGAVYAWITREMALGGWMSGKLPSWDQTQVFAEHPYLFFYFGALFVKLFGVSDVVLKLPNFLVAAFSIFTLFKIAKHQWTSEKAHQVGLIAGYVLLLNATYIMQISQPALDPLAQLLALVAVVVLAFGKNSFVPGLLLGTAFLAKGLELLPNLAGIFLLAVYLQRQNLKTVVKSILWLFVGVAIPLGLWLALDHYVWGGEWLNTYWTRQFTNRFLRSDNMNKVFDFGYAITVLRVYFFELIILGVALVTTSSWQEKKKDPLFLYFICYSFFNIVAFLIIKKDSSQHLTGVLLVGSVFVAEAIWEIWKKLGARRLQVIPVSLLVMAIAYWSWFFMNADRNPDIWTTVKNESKITKVKPVPVVVKDWTGEGYGIFHTAQWYSESDKVFFQAEADRLLVGREVLFFSEKENGQLYAARVIYQKGQN